jgi:hypothetical protein
LEKRLGALKSEFKATFPLTLHASKDSSSLTLFKDKIVYTEKETTLEIPFGPSFYLTYKPWTRTKGYILIKPSRDSSEEVKFKARKSYLKVLELIYLHLISWKHRNDLLLNNKELTTFQTQSPTSKKEPMISEKTIQLETVDKYREIPEGYQKYISHEKGEKVLFYYFPRFITKTLILLSVLTTAGIFSFIFALGFLNNPPTENVLLSIVLTLGLLMFGGIFGMAGPFYILLYGSQKLSKYIFTSEKIIIKRLKKIGTTPYSNISSITYNMRMNSQNINIELNKPLKSRQFTEKTSLYIGFVPEKLKLFEKIQNLK